MSNYIALIRRKPSFDDTLRCTHDLREAVHAGLNPMIFFQSEGVEMSGDLQSRWRALSPGVVLHVCRTSLERRMPADAMPSALSLATLVTFYQTLGSARRVDSLGLGGSVCCRPEGKSKAGGCPGGLLLEIGFSPADRLQRRETLEMALGAAALELEASVLFHGDGLEHLSTSAARGWAQITDFGLLGMYAEARNDLEGAQIPVQVVSATEAAELRARAATILIL